MRTKEVGNRNTGVSRTGRVTRNGVSDGTFNLQPTLRQKDLMWIHQRMRGGQEIFDFFGLDGKPECHGYELALRQRSSDKLGLLAIWLNRRDVTESHVMYYKRREDDDFQFVRGETYDGLPFDEFLDLMHEINDQEFMEGWQ